MKLKILPLRKTEPKFTITLYYTIGDADGEASHSMSFNELSENLIKLIRILNKIGNYVPRGFIGFIFDNEVLHHAYDDDILTLDEVNFLYNTPKDINYLIDYAYCDDGEFLVYKNFDITYIDENGATHLVKIIDDNT